MGNGGNQVGGAALLALSRRRVADGEHRVPQSALLADVARRNQQGALAAGQQLFGRAGDAGQSTGGGQARPPVIAAGIP